MLLRSKNADSSLMCSGSLRTSARLRMKDLNSSSTHSNHSDIPNKYSNRSRIRPPTRVSRKSLSHNAPHRSDPQPRRPKTLSTSYQKIVHNPVSKQDSILSSPQKNSKNSSKTNIHSKSISQKNPTTKFSNNKNSVNNSSIKNKSLGSDSLSIKATNKIIHKKALAKSQVHFNPIPSSTLHEERSKSRLPSSVQAESDLVSSNSIAGPNYKPISKEHTASFLKSPPQKRKLADSFITSSPRPKFIKKKPLKPASNQSNYIISSPAPTFSKNSDERIGTGEIQVFIDRINQSELSNYQIDSSINILNKSTRVSLTPVKAIFSPPFHLNKSNSESLHYNNEEGLKILTSKDLDSEFPPVTDDDDPATPDIFSPNHKEDPQHVMEVVLDSSRHEMIIREEYSDLDPLIEEIVNDIQPEDGVQIDYSGGMVVSSLSTTSTSSSSSSRMDLEILEFDPYGFMAMIPPVPPEYLNREFVLPPKPADGHPITLVLDLDETLVHCSVEKIPDPDFIFSVKFNGAVYDVYCRTRPYLQYFLEQISKQFEVVIFTASQQVYADNLLDRLDPSGKLINYRLFRDSCVYVGDNYVKDLTVLGRDLKSTVIVDNAPQVFAYQQSNGIPITSWYEEKDDTELLKLLGFLEMLSGKDDVRPIVESFFKTRERVVAAKMGFEEFSQESDIYDGLGQSLYLPPTLPPIMETHKNAIPLNSYLC
ncbi:CTD small phosphatase-like protein 2 [Smittium mucronatum]|uniref:CTD small phosphatase-like protein 2 n=1 Tax=Smittium mucronatum TaxID=133383 RepID=A0A1R0H4I6_9FUNG|nr:CTD small phosphatase-like protein 2 [Smittium mucronatum]